MDIDVGQSPGIAILLSFVPKIYMEGGEEMPNSNKRQAVGGGMPWDPLNSPQMTHFIRMQKLLLSETEKYSSEWFRRRCEAAATATRAVTETASGGVIDPLVVSRALIDWQRGSMQRLNEDFRDYLGMMNRCAQRMVEEESEAITETIEDVAKATKSTRAHSSPV
ncbi:hypothetical protein [Sedimentitalea nanhaiensis]|uniref:Phasin protein n=1 Tax=Sedimentitalea nanhaiensis TaxID=999627 RepID=A0A1I7BWG0_9RHOB|nr:hypothetical protein [Sedimentitalea nanhaiensis]SFT91546.1 hypothetical protein SAMN05216236_11294 [Sedimentitalea nanhaiensis]